MTYNFEYLYQEFSALAGMRKGNPAYTNDSTYWDGGHCNWGGHHNLREDCAVIGRGFEKLESLDSQAIIAELNKCTSEGEYESKKQNYLRKVNELTSGLQVRTGYSSSMFGICIIWADDSMSTHIESKLQECRREIETLKSQLGGEKYQHIEELRLLKLEQKQIETRMRERKKEAEKEKDPGKKAALLLLIEEDGKRLEENFRKQKAIPTSKISFDPKKHVERIMEGIRKALREKGGGSGGNIRGPGGSGGNRRSPNNPNDPFGDPNNWPEPNTIPKRTPRSNSDQPQNNQQLILIVAVVVIVIFFMMQKEPVQKKLRLLRLLMTNLNQIKNQLGEQTENLENKVNQLWEQFTPHYTNLEPWQRGLVLIGLLALLVFITYYLTHESQDLKTKRKIQAEQAQEEKIIRRMELLKKLRE